MNATNINSYIGTNSQIAIPGLDITTGGDSEWFYVNVPSSTTGTMSVTVQSSNLSSLSPKFQVYNSSLVSLGSVTAADSLGATISWSTSVQSGQGYYIKVLAAGGPGPIGGYGLLVNFGNQSQSPIPPPNTVVAQQPNQAPAAPSVQLTNTILTTVGTLSGWVELMSAPSSPSGSNSTSGANQGGSNLSGGSSSSSSGSTASTAQVGTVSVSTQPPAQSNAAVVVLGASPTVLQAVDSALDQLGSDD